MNMLKYPGATIVAESAEMQEVIEQVTKVAQTPDTTVLITGESGTGKDMVAQYIHYLSDRRSCIFNSVNCASVPGELFESEFFGHDKGVYTGADIERKGWFEASQNGSLFLDEIGELPLNMQAKFLRVLDEKSIYRMGDRRSIKINVRIIAATNKILPKLIELGKFRNDFYHRLNSFTIHIPPLRKRKGDIEALVGLYFDQFVKAYKKNIRKIDENVIEKLMDYCFPGNVRELQNLLQQAIIICDRRVLQLRHFSTLIQKNVTHTGTSPSTFNLEAIEKSTIAQALKYCNHHKYQTSKHLGISRQALDRKIIKHNIAILPKSRWIF